MTEKPEVEPQRRPRRAVEYGPTARTVAASVRRMRKRRGMSIYQLAAAMESAGRHVTADGIAKIERGERHVDVDDLMALAFTLGTPPSALLLPLEDAPGMAIEVTGAGTISAESAWDWLDGKRPLGASERFEGQGSHERLEHILYSRPPTRGHKEF